MTCGDVDVNYCTLWGGGAWLFPPMFKGWREFALLRVFEREILCPRLWRMSGSDGYVIGMVSAGFDSGLINGKIQALFGNITSCVCRKGIVAVL